MKLTLDALITIDAIARKHSFAAAAVELHRAPSSITYAVKKIEKQLGVSLFDRSDYRVSLTSAGEELLRNGRYILATVATTERNIMRIASGWEAELRIAINCTIPGEKFLPLLDEFYQIAPNTRIRLSTEILSGTWDALLSGRADLTIGAHENAPTGGGYQIRSLGEIEFLFVVAPHHALANEQEPINIETLRQHRAVAAADSTQGLPALTYGLLDTQNVLTVPSQLMKQDAIRLGLGVGHLPKHMLIDDLANKRLCVKKIENDSLDKRKLFYAWNTAQKGKALEWFEQRLSQLYKCSPDWFKE